MSEEQALSELMRDYAITFGSPAGQRVLADLEVYCHLIDALIIDLPEDSRRKDKSDRRMFMNEGRREVALRIMKMSKFTVADIYNLRKGVTALRTAEGEAIDG